MKCSNCQTEILPTFKHAFTKNECPACGEKIFDEEKLNLIKNVENIIMEEANIEANVANKLAVILATKYSFGGNIESKEELPQNIKIAQPSIARQVEQEANIVKAKEIEQMISQSEREKIMAEVASERYGLYDGVSAGFENEGSYEEEVEIATPKKNEFSSLFGGENEAESVLERERMLRLKKQQQSLSTGGKNSFSRGD